MPRCEQLLPAVHDPVTALQVPLAVHVVLKPPLKPGKQFARHRLPLATFMQLLGKPVLLAGAAGKAPLHAAVDWQVAAHTQNVA